MKGWKSVETRYLEKRERALRALAGLNRRGFLKASAAAAAAAAGLVYPRSFQPIAIARAAELDGAPFRIAYISDSHLYETSLNPRFVNAIMRAVDDVNALDPQPDFVIFGGDLAQLGQAKELELGAQILKELKAPLHVMVGEHDWYFDLGEKWRDLFGEPTYSFDHRGVHFVVLNSVIEDDFWTARKLTPMERMRTVAGLDDKIQSRFQVGAKQRAWLEKDLAHLPASTPLVVFSHSPLYKLYRPWNFWTEDAEEVQALLKRFSHVSVIHGHTHQLLLNHVDNINFYGMLSTAWPWPYAPEGLPPLTVQMGRADPFDPQDGCGDGTFSLSDDGVVESIYDLWNRNPITVRASYLSSNGKVDVPPAPALVSY